MSCAPQRFLANNRNILRTAALTPSSVEPIADQVIETDQPRKGTAQVALTGTYTGPEEAQYDIEVLDNTVDTKLISAPVFSGAGSGTITGITSTADPQEYTVELADAGIPALYAGTDLEGVHLRARAIGAAGNNIRLTIDQTPLTFADNFGGKKYSLLDDLPAGSGGETNGVEGPAFDWDTKVLGADNLIPDDAHRVAFGDDRGAVYLQYKKFADGKWTYHFVPAIQRTIPQGTPVRFVSGGRTVTVTNGVGTPETHAGIVTLYDLLNSLKTASALVDVDGVIAKDRSPSGQASRELLTRTDAHAEPSSGGGSSAARGFESVFVNADANTELVTARCFAVTAADHPLAHVGAELWNVTGSLSGDLGTVTTGVPFSAPDGKWGFTIPVRLPDGFGTARGRISVSEGPIYQPRQESELEPPPICVVGMLLGPSAVDQSIRFVWTKRPSGDCNCASLPVPNLNTSCLGNIGVQEGSTVYQVDTVAKLKALWQWFRDYVAANTSVANGSATEDDVISQESNPRFKSLQSLVAKYESVLFTLDKLPAGTARDDGMDAWDVALSELQDRIEEWDADVTVPASELQLTMTAVADDAIGAGQAVTIYKDPSGGPTWRAKLAIASRGSYVDTFGLTHNGDQFGVYGFTNAAAALGDSVTVHLTGVDSGLTGLTPGAYYWPSFATPGTWTTSPADAICNQEISAGVFKSQPWTTFVSGENAGFMREVPLEGFAITSSALRVTSVQASFFPAGSISEASSSSRDLASIPSDRFDAFLSYALAAAGLDPLGKSDASILESGDGCWHDFGGDYWVPVGADGAYGPVFNNEPAYGVRRASATGAYYSTHEWALQVNVKCPERLKYGDEFTVTIGGAGYGATYQKDDTLSLPIVAAQPLYLAGGQPGSTVQKWFVTGGQDGPLPVFNYDPASPTSYSGGGLSFTLAPGGVPFEKGDRFRFRLEGGHWRWRKTIAGVAGSWSSSIAIPSAPTALDAGLSIAFTTGAAPSFVAGDLYTFRALQPWAVSNISDPTPYPWKWSGSDATLLIDAGAVVDVDGFAMAFHTLPAGATITVQGRNATSGAYDWAETLTWQAGAIALPFAVARTARQLLLTITSAAGGRIGWAWAGEMFRTTWPADFVPRRSVKIVRGSSGDGLLQGGRYRGKTVSGDVMWNRGYLPDADMDGLIDLFEWSKSNDDEPFVFIPQVTRPEESLVAQITTDEIEYPELMGMQPNADVERKFQLTLPLQGIYQS